MRTRSWLVPLTACFLLAGALALRADAPPVTAASPWWSRPIAHPAPRPAPGDVAASGQVPGASVPGAQVPGVLLPILDGAFFKLKVACRGKTVDPFTGLTETRSLKFTAYMLLQANDPGPGAAPGDGDGGGGGGSAVPTYQYFVWVEDGLGEWQLAGSETLFTAGADENGDATLAVNSLIGFFMPTALVAARVTGTLAVKRDPLGELKSARFKTLSSDLEQSLVLPEGFSLGAEGLEFYGAMTISGATIALDKLPFVPV